MKKITPIVLAGGTGTRFAPFISDKLLWPLHGEAFVLRFLRLLAQNGLNSIIVVANKDNRAFFEEIKLDGVSIRIVIQESDGGMSAALQSTRPHISKQPILVLNAGDIFEDTLIKHVLSMVSDTSTDTLLVGLKCQQYTHAGYLNIQGDLVKSVVEKPEIDKRPSDFVKLVVDYFSDSDKLFDCLDKTPFAKGSDSHYEDSLNLLLMDKPAKFIPYSGFWGKLKFPFHVLDVMNIYMAKGIQSYKHKTAKIAPSAIIEDNVYIDENAVIEANAVIKSNCYIGKNVIIGNNTLVRSSFIEADSVIGFGTEIARSYVGPRCHTHHAFIGDSVLESDINMSFGVVTANLRIDGREVGLKHPNGERIQTTHKKLGAMIAKGAFLGVNASTMPGVCISSNTQILPSTIVKKTI